MPLRHKEIVWNKKLKKYLISELRGLRIYAAKLIKIMQSCLDLANVKIETNFTLNTNYRMTDHNFLMNRIEYHSVPRCRQKPMNQMEPYDEL